MIETESLLRVREIEAYEAIALDRHAEIVRLILAEVSMLTDKYRYVRRHDVPHIRELAGLIDLLWQEVEMYSAIPAQPALLEEIGTY
jgi:hypothetical protein